MVHVETGDGTGYAWALRLDDATEADEFVRGFCAAMDVRSTPVNACNDPYELFVRSATLSGENETVSVSRE